MKASKASAITILFLFVIFMLIPASQVQGAMTADNFVTEVTTMGSIEAYVIDVDSNGNIFLYEKGDNDIYKSTDQGATWTKVLDKTATTSYSFVVFVDSRDYVYVQTWRTAGLYDFWRSTDGGSTWTNLGDSYGRFWHMVEDSSGNLYVNTYVTASYIYRSTDQGATFSLWYNTTGEADHLHAVGVDIANDDIYISAGDNPNGFIRRYNGTAWENVTTNAESSTLSQPTDIWSDGTYVYFAPDGAKQVNRITSGGSWSTTETVLDLKYAPEPTANFAFEAVRYSDGVTLLGTEDGQLWGSWDGENWVKIIDTEGASDSFFSISNRRPIYVTNRADGKLYRINIQKEDLIQLFYKQHHVSKGSLTNTQSYVLEQRIWSGTNYVDLTDVVLTDVQASIKGLSRNQWQVNGGFETGDKTGWAETTSPLGVIKSDSPANDTYYYARNHTASTNYLWTRENTLISASEGDVTLLSYYIKSNASQADAYQVIYFTDDGSQWSYSVDVTTSWQRYTHYYVLDNLDTEGKWYFRFLNFPLETSIDSVMYLYLEAGIHLGRANLDSIVNMEGGQTGAWDGSNKTTTNPTLTINSQTVSHSGSLSNDTESSSTSLTGTLSGMVEVSATISGSSQAILRLTGTRHFYEDSTILRGKSSTDVYYGRFYGTFSPTATLSELVAVTSLTANITKAEFAGEMLTLEVDSPTGTSSTTKVYCAGKGEPKTVTGHDSKSYDNGILTLTVNNHASSKTLKVRWGGSASGKYELVVYVKKDGVSYPNALVTVDGEEKNTDLLGQASFELSTGTYFVEASLGGETKNKTVTVHDSTSIGFEFLTFQANRAPSIILEVVIVVVVGVVLYLFVYPMFVRKRK